MPFSRLYILPRCHLNKMIENHLELSKSDIFLSCTMCTLRKINNEETRKETLNATVSSHTGKECIFKGRSSHISSFELEITVYNKSSDLSVYSSWNILSKGPDFTGIHLQRCSRSWVIFNWNAKSLNKTGRDIAYIFPF